MRVLAKTPFGGSSTAGDPSGIATELSAPKMLTRLGAPARRPDDKISGPAHE